MKENSRQYLLRWKEYRKAVSSAVQTLRHDEELLDVTLACNGKTVRAHKLVLAVSSQYFRQVLKDYPCEHPTIVIEGISWNNLLSILQFIYYGEVLVQEDCIAGLLYSASTLGIVGLTHVTNAFTVNCIKANIEPTEKQKLQNDLNFEKYEYSEDIEPSEDIQKQKNVYLKCNDIENVHQIVQDAVKFENTIFNEKMHVNKKISEKCSKSDTDMISGDSFSLSKNSMSGKNVDHPSESAVKLALGVELSDQSNSFVGNFENYQEENHDYPLNVLADVTIQNSLNFNSDNSQTAITKISETIKANMNGACDNNCLKRNSDLASKQNNDSTHPKKFKLCEKAQSNNLNVLDYSTHANANGKSVNNSYIINTQNEVNHGLANGGKMTMYNDKQSKINGIDKKAVEFSSINHPTVALTAPLMALAAAASTENVSQSDNSFSIVPNDKSLQNPNENCLPLWMTLTQTSPPHSPTNYYPAQVQQAKENLEKLEPPKLAFHEPRPCSTCHRMYRDAATLRTHIAIMHSKGPDNFYCTCGERFMTKFDMYKHKKMGHR